MKDHAMSMSRTILMLCLGAVAFGTFFIPGTAVHAETERRSSESLQEIGARLAKESTETYAASPFATLSKDWFARYSRNPQATADEQDVVLDASWTLVLPESAAPLSKRMLEHFQDFMQRSMGVPLAIAGIPPTSKAIVLSDTAEAMAGGQEGVEIQVRKDRIDLRAGDPRGIRYGIVWLTDAIGMRGAPFLKTGTYHIAPKLAVRLGTIPNQGGMRELVFSGHNAIFSGGGSLFAMSTSNAIPELDVRKIPNTLESQRAGRAAAREYGLKTYAFLSMRQKFPEEDPVFKAHPEIRGARTWKEDGEFALCTETPLMQQYITESIRGIFESDPELDGITAIIGGESFYHCFMRPYGVEKGHTNCERCDKLGAETVVANLCNRMARAAREINPRAEVIVWPYSAAHVWSIDPDQLPFIAKLEPGVALLTEIEKDAYVQKPAGVNKHLWDYSIDMTGLSGRATRQIAACTQRNIPVYLKSEPELGFEAPRLPHIPCMDHWVDRADALAASGATGAFVFPAFRPCYGTSASELNKHAWYTTAPDKDTLLEAFAARIAGEDAGPALRTAWRHVSAAIDHSPELPPYYTGPYYLGPAHPMCADAEAELPDVFYGAYLFYAEIADAEGVKLRPTFFTNPRGDAPVFAHYYRRMEAALAEAVQALDPVQDQVPDRCQLMYAAEDSAIRWFYHTARAHANFYESCLIRERMQALREKDVLTDSDIANAKEDYQRWRAVLADELENAQQALPLVERDMRLDWYYGGDHTFPHAADMIRAKIEITEAELDIYLPSIAQALGV